MIATKEQERNTLEKIKRMVSELGENSYLASAFDGAFELAEQNIEYDAAFSTQYYIDQDIDQAKKIADVEKREKKTNQELIETKAMLSAVQEAHRTTTENFDATQERESKYAHEIDDLKTTLKAKEVEIITLKAKLYDYMSIPA